MCLNCYVGLHACHFISRLKAIFAEANSQLNRLNGLQQEEHKLCDNRVHASAVLPASLHKAAAVIPLNLTDLRSQWQTVLVNVVADMNQRAHDAVAEADRWRDNMGSKVASCMSAESGSYHDSIEARLSTIRDISELVPDGRALCDTVLRRVEIAEQATLETDIGEEWAQRWQKLVEDWNVFEASLHAAR